MKIGARSLKINVLILIVFGLLAGLVGTLKSGQAQPSCVVGEGLKFPTIKSAIEEKGCRIILVEGGIYRENLLIDRELALEVERYGDKVTIIGDGRQPTIQIVGTQNVIIGFPTLDPEIDKKPSGFLITQEGENKGKPGIFIRDSSNIWITQNHIKGNYGSGVELQSSKDIVITMNAITNNGNCGIRQDKYSTIKLDSSKNNRIVNKKGNLCVDDKQQDAASLRLTLIKISKDEFFTDFPSIQEAIDAAVEGDSIVVASGRVGEFVLPYALKAPLRINKSLTLQGDNPEDTILQAPNSQTDVIDISGAPGKSITIQKVSITGGAAGIKAENTSTSALKLIINDVTIQENANEGIKIRGKVEANICELLPSCVVRIEGNSLGIFAESIAQDNSLFSPIINIQGTTIISSSKNEGLMLKGKVSLKKSSPSNFDIIRSGKDGIILQDEASLELNDGTLISSNNGGNGISLSGQATINVNVNKKEVGYLQVSQNGKDGLILADKASLNVMEGGQVTILTNGKDGLVLSASTSATVPFANISSQTANGIHVKDCAQLTLTGSSILNNGENGILLNASKDCSQNQQKMQVKINGNEIKNNKLWGVAYFSEECFFEATLTGKQFRENATRDENGNPITADSNNNTLEGNGANLTLEPFLLEGDENGQFCPRSLNFLISKQGT